MTEFYNAPEGGQLMTKFINSGRTVIFTDETQAEKDAQAKNTYHFQVWQKFKNGRREFHGFGVSK